MNHTLLVILDYFFLVFHLVFTLFNMTGWIWKKTRKLHMITMGATLLSWFVAGIWYGWGYCFCTDWHWQVREQLGEPIISNSYIHFLIKEFTNISLSEKLVDNTVLLIFLVSLLLTIYLNISDRVFYLRDKKRKAKKETKQE